MAAPDTLRFGASTFYIGDGADPEVFTKVCGMTQADISFDKSTGSTTVPDCDDPDAGVWESKDVQSMSWSASFQGVLAIAAMPLLETVGLAGKSYNIRVDEKGAGTGTETPIRRLAGAAIIKYSKSGKRGERWQVKIDCEGDGAPTITSVAVV